MLDLTSQPMDSKVTHHSYHRATAHTHSHSDSHTFDTLSRSSTAGLATTAPLEACVLHIMLLCVGLTLSLYVLCLM
jgi:hypothetical protein